MTTVILVRHCETEFNRENRIQGWSDSELTTEGKTKVSALAKYINGKFDCVYSSSSIRAIKTALILCRNYKHISDIKTLSELKEINLEPWEGHLIESVLDVGEQFGYDTYKNNPSHFRAHSGEGFREVQARIVKAISTIASENSNRIVLVVSHNCAIASLINYYRGGNIAKIWDVNVAPASVTELFFNGDLFAGFGSIAKSVDGDAEEIDSY